MDAPQLLRLAGSAGAAAVVGLSLFTAGCAPCEVEISNSTIDDFDLGLYDIELDEESGHNDPCMDYAPARGIAQNLSSGRSIVRDVDPGQHGFYAISTFRDVTTYYYFPDTLTCSNGGALRIEFLDEHTERVFAVCGDGGPT